MEERFKLTLYNRTIYKEVELLPECSRISIGTRHSNDVRLRRDLFFTDFSLTLVRDKEAWNLECSDGIYIDNGDIRRILNLSLVHGDEFSVKYQDSDSELLKVGFYLDFDYQDKKYDCIVDISGRQGLTIGYGSDCSICLDSQLVKGTLALLYLAGDGFWLEEKSAPYGIYKNGLRINGRSRLSDYDFFSIANYYFFYKENKLYTDVDDTMRFNGIGYVRQDAFTALSYPAFNRNTRIKSVLPDMPIPVLDPPEKPEKPENNLLMSVMPAVTMLILTVVLRGFMGSGGTFVIFSACTISMGIITSIITYVQGKKKYQTKIQNREASYLNYIEQKRKEIIQSREEERLLLEHIFQDIDHDLEEISEFSGDLFDRLPEDEDFLCIRLGTGSKEAIRKVQYKMQERFVSDDELTYLPKRVEAEFFELDKAPVVVDLKNAGAVGFVGEDTALYGMAGNLILDLAARQYYGEARMVFIMNEDQKEVFEWIRFLPHAACEGNRIRNIACDPESRTALFESLYKELAWREKNKKEGSFIHLVIFVLDDMGMKRHPISKYIADAASIHVTFLFWENKKEYLPMWCSSIAYMSVHSGTLISADDEKSRTDFFYNPVEKQRAMEAALRLAPVFCEEVNLEGSLVKSITLFDLLGIYGPEDLDLTKRWAESRVDKSMAAPLGVKAKNEEVYLDIHEKAHGPHGLVAGTTGSGKSEILQSYILSMATLFHPYEVGFLIIDFKGGGMANQFQNLPHLIGAITNIDGKQIQRSLLSIRAELLKRQNYFAAAEVNHIDKYIVKYKKGEVKEPLPHLIIIVDEFAELKAEFPDFMKELISTARIGRSLGVHLILATQKPSGQVNEQIWSNSRFKLCLKVQTPEDSNEMIHSPLAAEIIEPGRAYFQVGNNEVFELFQSGYSGAPEKNVSDVEGGKEFGISKVNFSGKREWIYRRRKKEGEVQARTQLEALVTYVMDCCEENNIARLPSICLPPLPVKEYYPVQGKKPCKVEIMAEIGILDDPSRQRQDSVFLNFSQENILIIGASQYGKTNLLQTIIRGLASSYTPDEVNIYILDFGSMVLKNLESLPHVGGVAGSSEDEKFKNLFKMLIEEINRRKELLVEAGVSSFTAYKEAGKKDLPQIVLMVDNFTAVKEFYLQEEDVLMAVCREGLSVGISTVICNSQTSGMGYRYMANFSKRIALYCNESSEYGTVIEKCRMEPENVPGRAIIEIDKTVYEMQTYLSFKGEKEIQRVEEMKKFAGALQQQYPGKKARRIPEVPAVLEEEVLEREYGISRKDSYKVPVGLIYDSVEPMYIDLLHQGVFGIMGRPGSGKKRFLHVIMDQLRRNMFSCPVEAFIVDSSGRSLRDLADYGFVREYSIDSMDLITFVEDIYAELIHRYDDVAEGRLENLNESPLMFVIVQNADAIVQLCKNTEALRKYRELQGRLKEMKVCFLLMDMENAPVPYSGPEIMKSVKEDKNFFYFDNLQNIKICEVSAQTQKLFKKKISPGDCYWLEGNEIHKVKIVKRLEGKG